MEQHLNYAYGCEDDEMAPTEITSVTFAPNLTHIKQKSFWGCQYLTAAILPDTVLAIEREAFHACASIVELRLSSILETIGERAFQWCSSIALLHLPFTVITIRESCFENCTSLAEIRILQPKPHTNQLLLTTIERLAFANCSSLTRIPNLFTFLTLESIGSHAFLNCTSLTEVTLGPSVSCARNAFQGCTSLSMLRCTYRTGNVVPWAVTHVILDGTIIISRNAFAGCGLLHDIKLTNKPTLKVIGNSAFWGCQSLLELTIKKGVTVGIGAFAHCGISNAGLPPHALQEVYTWTNSEHELSLDGISELIIDPAVTIIPKRAFYKRRDLLRVRIHSPEIALEQCAFDSCPSLHEIIFLDTAVVTIANDAFVKCRKLTTVQMPHVIQLVLEGNYGARTSSSARLPLSKIHYNIFRGCHFVTKSNAYYSQYNNLQTLWDWVFDLEQRSQPNLNGNSTNVNIGINQSSLLLEQDWLFLRKLFHKVPPPPDDIIEAVIDSLSNHDWVFCQFPRDVIYKVLEFF